MTFTTLQTKVLDRLRLTSTTATTRVGQEINERYRQVMSSLGLNSVGWLSVTANVTSGQRVCTFAVTKIFIVYDTAYTPPLIMNEITMDEMRNRSILTGDLAREYSVQTQGTTSVTILLNSTASTTHALSCDGEGPITDLSGSTAPAFSEDFHDVLLEGTLADELYVLERYDEAQVHEAKFEKRLSELRFFLAKSSYLQIYQGKNRVRRTYGPYV